VVDAYYFCVGGSLGQFASIARPVGYRCAATDVPDAIERLLNHFTANHGSAENLRQFLARHSSEQIRHLLAGTAAEPMARDVAVGSVPHSVEA